MTADELKRQTLKRIRLSLKPGQIEKAETAADDVLSIFVDRNRKSPAPYHFDARGVLWLERQIRLRIK